MDGRNIILNILYDTKASRQRIPENNIIARLNSSYTFANVNIQDCELCCVQGLGGFSGYCTDNAYTHTHNQRYIIYIKKTYFAASRNKHIYVLCTLYIAHVYYMNYVEREFKNYYFALFR